MAKAEWRKARKDYPESGIKKGDSYQFAQIKTGPRSSRIIRSLTAIPRWQLTSSEFLREIYQIEDRIDKLTSMSDVEDIISDLRDVGQGEQSKFDNMPEGLQQGETGQMIEQRASACETAADGMDEILSRWNDQEGEIGENVMSEEDFLDEVRSISIDY